MSPNPYTLLKLLVSPHRWSITARRSSSTESVKPRERWNEPVPGIYEYKPGRGWYLVEYIEDATTTTSSNPAGNETSKPPKNERLPRKVTYCKMLERNMFESEFQARQRAEYIKVGAGLEVEHVWFFRLDDGVTYIKCWDTFGNFLRGPWERYCIDEKTRKMRPIEASDLVIDGESVRTSRLDSLEKSKQQIVAKSNACSVCSSPRMQSPRRPAYEGRRSASTFAESSRSAGTALTTPASGIISQSQTTDEVDPKELRAELSKIHGP